MRSIDTAPRNERGIALVMAILVLLVISLLAAVLMMSLNVDRRITGHTLRSQLALNNAEAGIEEAVARLRANDIPDNGNPAMVTQIFRTLPGNVPALGADSTGLATAQPVGQWLDYSSAGRGPDALTVQYKTNAAGDTVYRWDDTKNPAVQTSSGYPIFVVTSTGRTANDIKRIQTEMIREPFIINIRSAMAADVTIKFSGDSDMCGYNHSMTTPVGTKGRPPCDGFETGVDDLPGGWSSGPITSTGSASQWGSPAATTGNQTGFYAGPWEALQMTQASFFTWVGAPVATEPQPPVGIVYLDNNTTSQDATGSFMYNGGDGEGLLYVDGDLTLNGNFNYKGLIYVEGDVDINGTFWLLGALICKGKTEIKLANGAATVLYSGDTIRNAISKHGGTFVTLSWKELDL